MDYSSIYSVLLLPLLYQADLHMLYLPHIDIQRYRVEQTHQIDHKWVQPHDLYDLLIILALGGILVIGIEAVYPVAIHHYPEDNPCDNAKDAV